MVVRVCKNVDAWKRVVSKFPVDKSKLKKKVIYMFELCVIDHVVNSGGWTGYHRE